MYQRARGWHYAIDGTLPDGDRAMLVAAARRVAMGWLRSEVVSVDEAAVMDIETAMGEALSNVARHAGTATHFVVSIGHGRGWCRFEVRDDGRLQFSPRRALLRGQMETASIERTSGRGLLICDGLMDEFRVTSRRTGCVVVGVRRCGCGGGK